jgi:hypothetical protein
VSKRFTAVAIVFVAFAVGVVVSVLRMHRTDRVRTGPPARPIGKITEGDLVGVAIYDKDPTRGWNQPAVRFALGPGVVFEDGEALHVADLAAYVDAEAKSLHADYLVLTPSSAMSYAEILAAAEKFRRCHLAMILISNELALGRN